MKNQPNQPAVDELYAKIKKFVARRVHQTQDQEELVQEIFLKMKQSLDQLRDTDRLLPWLYRIAHHQIVDHYRSQKPKAGSWEPPDTKEDENQARQEVASWLKYFIQDLPKQDREILELVLYQGLTQKEAADLLGLTLPGAKSRHQRAKQRLKMKLQKCCDFYLDPRKKIIGYQSKQREACCDD